MSQLDPTAEIAAGVALLGRKPTRGDIERPIGRRIRQIVDTALYSDGSGAESLRALLLELAAELDPEGEKAIAWVEQASEKVHERERERTESLRRVIDRPQA